jgi:hypothetical protein
MTIHRIFRLGLMAAFISAPLAVHAQTATGTGQAAAGATAGAGAQSGSAAIIQQTFTSPGQQSLTYGGGTTNRVIQEGGYRQDYRATIRNTPDAYAPNVSGGTNSCLVGMSGAGSVAGFGIGLGGNWSDPDCERRQLAALAHNTGQTALAQEVLCGSRDVREARARLGQPCLADVQRQQAAAVQQPVAVVQPTPVAYREVVGGGAPPAVRTVPDWCATASAAERRQYRSTCG